MINLPMLLLKDVRRYMMVKHTNTVVIIEKPVLMKVYLSQFYCNADN